MGKAVKCVLLALCVGSLSYGEDYNLRRLPSPNFSSNFISGAWVQGWVVPEFIDQAFDSDNFPVAPRTPDFDQILAYQADDAFAILFPQVAASKAGTVQVRTDGDNSVSNQAGVQFVQLELDSTLQMFNLHWIPDTQSIGDGVIDGNGEIISEVLQNNDPNAKPYAHGLLYIVMTTDTDKEPLAENEIEVNMFDGEDWLRANLVGAAGWTISYDYAQVDGNNHVTEYEGSGISFGYNASATFRVYPSKKSFIGDWIDGSVDMTTSVNMYSAVPGDASYNAVNVGINAGVIYSVSDNTPVQGHWLPFEN